MAAQPRADSKIQRERRGKLLVQLLDRHGAKLRRQARRHAQRPADADDALQDAAVAFLRCYEGAGGEDALRWMQLVTKRFAWAIGKRASRRLELDPRLLRPESGELAELELADEDSPGPLERAERSAELAEAIARLDELKPDERTALLLLGLGCSYREICELRGWSYTKVNRCIAEGRAALRTMQAEGER